MQQYPHFLFVRSLGISTQNDDGSWTAGTDRWVFHSICREQTNGKGSLINTTDGRSILYSSVIHLPIQAGRIVEGTEVLVTEGENETDQKRVGGMALKFDAGQLHNRLWV